MTSRSRPDLVGAGSPLRVTPEHLVDVAAFSIISAIHLKREAKEAMNRAVVALSMIKPRD
jgi:hypothetical protein